MRIGKDNESSYLLYGPNGIVERVWGLVMLGLSNGWKKETVSVRLRLPLDSPLTPNASWCVHRLALALGLAISRASCKSSLLVTAMRQPHFFSFWPELPVLPP